MLDMYIVATVTNAQQNMWLQSLCCLDKQPKVNNKKYRIASLFTYTFYREWNSVEAKQNMKSQRPDLMVIISIVFVFGAVATSLSANSDDQAKNMHAQVSQHIIR